MIKNVHPANGVGRLWFVMSVVAVKWPVTRISRVHNVFFVKELVYMARQGTNKVSVLSRKSLPFVLKQSLRTIAIAEARQFHTSLPSSRGHNS